MRSISKPLSLALIVIAVISLLVWTTFYWYKNYIYNQEVFSKTIVTTIQTDKVSDSIARSVVDEALKDSPLLGNLVGDFAQSTISGLIQSSQFKVVLDEAARGFHEIVVSSELKDVTLDISPIVDVSNVMLNIASITESELPQEISQNLEEVSKLDRKITLVYANMIPSFYNVTVTFSWLGPLAGVLSIILFGFVLWASQDRYLTIIHIGVTSSLGILIYLLAIPYFQHISVVSAGNELTRSIIEVIYALFSDYLVAILRIQGVVALVVILIGFILRRTKHPLEAKPSEK
ncbi:hypothetical protein ACFL0F_01300 [Patescibacteria group bacterium]